jgi:hypothetical protein
MVAWMKGRGGMHAACAEGKNGRGKKGATTLRCCSPFIQVRWGWGTGRWGGTCNRRGPRGVWGGVCPTPTDALVDSGPRPAGAGGWCGVVMPHGRRETGERRGLTGGPLLQSRGLNPSSVNRSTLFEFEFQLVRTSTNPNLTSPSSKNINKIWF